MSCFVTIVVLASLWFLGPAGCRRDLNKEGDRTDAGIDESAPSNVVIVSDRNDVEQFLESFEIVHDGIWIPAAKDVLPARELAATLSRHVASDYQMNADVVSDILKLAKSYHWEVSGMILNSVKYQVVHGSCWSGKRRVGKFNRIADGGACTVAFVLDNKANIVQVSFNPP